MTWKYTVKQLFRTPGKLLLFFLLLVLSAALLVSGFNLWANTGETLSQMSQAYTTRGTVRQLADTTELVSYTNALGSFTFEQPIYTKEMKLEELSSLPYLVPPENRPVLYTKGIREKNGNEILTYPNTLQYAVIKFRVQEDFNNLSGETTGQPGERTASGCDQATLSSLSVLQEDGSFAEVSLPGSQVLIPQSSDPYSYDFKASEEYVAYAYLDARATPMVTLRQYSYSTATTPASTEYSGLEELYYPYSDHFLTTEEGKLLLAYARNSALFSRNAFPTVPTNDNMLLEPFFKKWITMKYGRTITAEEYASGAKVCMVPEYLASDPSDSDTSPSGYNNYMSVGDQLTLSFYGAVYSLPPVDASYDPKQSLNAPLFPKEEMEPFATETYEIVGVYRQQVPSDTDDTAMFGYLQVIIPEKSIEGGVSNIVAGGPFVPQNVSFLLENGSADSFLLEFDKLGYDNLQVEVDDMGYAEVARGVEAVMLVARILFFSGLAGVLCVLVFFVFLQVARRERETAVQISLGSGKRRAAASLLLAVMLVAIPGSAGGALLGHAVSGRLSEQVYDTASQSAYSREYSDLYASESQEQVTLKTEAQPGNTLAAAVGIVACALLLTGFFAARNLRKEPLALLSKGGDRT